LQCRAQMTSFLVDKARMKELTIGNKRAVTVTPLIIFILSAGLYLYLL